MFKVQEYACFLRHVSSLEINNLFAARYYSLSLTKVSIVGRVIWCMKMHSSPFLQHIPWPFKITHLHTKEVTWVTWVFFSNIFSGLWRISHLPFSKEDTTFVLGNSCLFVASRAAKRQRSKHVLGQITSLFNFMPRLLSVISIARFLKQAVFALDFLS